MTEAELESVLQKAPQGPDVHVNPILTAHEAKYRAKLIYGDLEQMGLKLDIKHWPIPQLRVVVPYYEIFDSDFGKVDTDEHSGIAEVYKAHGLGLNWGDLVRFSKACKIGHELIGSSWPKAYASRLLNGKEHLACIEEILWLGLWHDVAKIEREPRPYRELGFLKGPDWGFASSGMPINLEVKYRPMDWIRHVDGPEYSKVFPSYFKDLPTKFPLRKEGELNLVAISSPAPADRSWRLEVESLLKGNPTIDGVLLWSHSSQGEQPFEIHSVSKKPLIETLFTFGTPEDHLYIGMIMHLWRNRDERRAVRASEVTTVLEKLRPQ